MADTGQLRVLPSVADNGVKNEIASPPINPAEVFHRKQYRWNTSEEIYSILTATSRHPAWLSSKTELLPANGSVILYDRDTEGLNYRRDGYIWKKRKDGKHIREDHMRLRVRGTEMVNGYYTHSAILSSFHRRSYNLPGRPNIMLVHYLNAPVEGIPSPVPTLKHCDKRVWDREELAQQIYPMYDMLDDLTNNRGNVTHYVPPGRHIVDRMIDSLLASQTTEGVQVTAQWVLSLGSNGSYLVQAQPQTPAFQIPNGNVQLVLAPLKAGPVMQPTQAQQCSSVGLVSVANPVPIAPSTDRPHLSHNSSSQKLLSKSAAMQADQSQTCLPTFGVGTQLQSYQTTSALTLKSQAITPECAQPAFVRSIASQDTVNGSMTASPTHQHVQGVTTPTLHGRNGHCVQEMSTSLSHDRQLQGGTIPTPLSHSALERTTGVVHGLHEMTTPLESGMLGGSHPITVHEQLSTIQTPLSAAEQGREACSSLERDLAELSQLPMDVTPPQTTPAEAKDTPNVNTDLIEDMNTELNDICAMTADEISNTLSANMPMSYSPVAAADLTNDLQLDSNFDLFAELNVNGELTQSVFNSTDSNDLAMPQMVKLTALAPEWSYVDGGCKVLLVGPWKMNSASDYSCLFGTKSVKAELVQDGVLSCITPAHEHGEVEVKVSHLGHVISESSRFEFRDRKSELSRHRSWFLCEESRLQMALIDRLDMIKCRLDILFPAPALTDQMNLEQRVVALLHAIKRYKWKARDPLPKTSFKGLTLFHLAAALGYRTLLETLNSWREESACELLCEEVSTRARDANGCIALHWACALGRMETALVMYYMDRLSLDEVSNDGMTPLSLARAFKNKHVVEMLVQQENTVLETKLDSQGLHKLPPAGSKHLLRRSASPARHTSPVRHPPVTRHNSTPNSTCLPPPFPHSSHQSGPYEGVPSCSTPEPLQAMVGEQSEDDEDSIVDIEGLSDNECSNVTDQDRDNQRIRTLAEHIIAAIPERIKSTASDDSSSVALLTYRERSSSRSSYSSTPSYAEDSGVCTPLTSDWVEEWNRSRLSSSPCFSAESIHRTSHSPSFYPPYYHPPAVSPALTPNIHNTSAASTTSYNTGRSESPPPSAQILGEYFNAGEGVEYGLSQLTLSDTEQRKLYQAAQVIQHAFRQFKDKKQQQKEIEAAVIIQTYYRRFKEFTTLRHIQKQQAATRIQSQFRSYYAQKRFKKSRDAALLIQHHYRAYKEHEHFKRSRSAAVLIQQKFRTHYNRKKCSKQPSQDASGSRDGNSLRVMHHYPASTHK